MLDNIKYEISLPKLWTAKELAAMPYTKMKSCSILHDINYYNVERLKCNCKEIISNLDKCNFLYIEPGKRRKFFYDGQRISCKKFYSLESNAALNRVG